MTYDGSKNLRNDDVGIPLDNGQQSQVSMDDLQNYYIVTLIVIDLIIYVLVWLLFLIYFPAKVGIKCCRFY